MEIKDMAVRVNSIIVRLKQHIVEIVRHATPKPITASGDGKTAEMGLLPFTVVVR